MHLALHRAMQVPVQDWRCYDLSRPIRRRGALNGLPRAALSCSVLATVAALAAPQGTSTPSIVPHPLVVVGGSEDDAARLGPQLDAELSRRDVHVVGRECARQFVAERTGGSCAGDEQCLAD